MSITITATATGSFNPPIENTDEVLNEDFSITSNPGSTQPAGDGINEMTRWTFDFTGDRDFKAFMNADGDITSARLTLVLEPRSVAFETDSVIIDVKDPYRRITEFPELPIGRAYIIQLDMMHGKEGVYEPREILDILTGESAEDYGKIPMLYEEDAFVCFAQLELTR